MSIEREWFNRGFTRWPRLVNGTTVWETGQPKALGIVGSVTVTILDREGNSLSQEFKNNTQEIINLSPYSVVIAGTDASNYVVGFW